MSYNLDQFVSDCRSILKRDPGPNGREEVRTRLERLLSNKDFVEEYCGEYVPLGWLLGLGIDAALARLSKYLLRWHRGLELAR